MAEFRSCREGKTTMPKASGGDDTARQGSARGESKGWRLVEVRGGTALRLAFYRVEGGAGAAPMAVELGGGH
jgi:hypothetical protein